MALKGEIESAPTDGTEVTITLQGDITNMETAQILTIKKGQNIVLNMDGHRITVNEDFTGRPIVNNGILKVIGNGTIDSTNSEFGGYGAINNFGNLTIENGIFKGHVCADGSAIYNRPEGTAVIENGYFEGRSAIYNGGTLTVNNGTFYTTSCTQTKDSKGKYGHWAYCINSHGNLIFNNGTVTGALAIGGGTGLIYDGIFKTVICKHDSNGGPAHYAIYIAGETGGATATIYGGTYTAASKAAIMVGNDNKDGDGGINEKASVQIKGGTFTSKEGVNVMMTGPSTGTPVITGGKFRNNGVSIQDSTAKVLKNYVPEGTDVVESSGIFTIAPDVNAVAQVGDAGFTTLEAAIAAAEDGDTAKLLGDVTNAQGISIPSGKNFTLDFAGRTYTLTGPGAGSANTETNGFQLLKDSDITFKNGTIKIAENANKIKRIIQNYANLKLEDMKFYAKNQVGGENYPLSFNNGNIVFSGNTSIITSNDDTIAFDVYYWKEAYPNGTSVTFDNSYTGTINGKILYDSVDPEKAKLVINGNGSFGAVETSKDTKNGQSITITGGTFSTDPKEYVASGYTVDGSGPYTVKAVSSGIPSIPTTPTDNVTNSGSAAADNATTSADLSNTTSTSNGTTTATVDKTTADKIVDKAVEDKSTEVVIDATANTTTAANSTTVAQVTIPTETLGAIAEKTEADVTIKTDVAEVKMDNAAAAAVSEQATGDTVQIVAEKVAEETDKVEFELKVVCSDGKVISDFKGGNIAVTVALPKAMAEKKVVCVYIDDNGHMSKVEGQKNADGTYTFFTGHFSTYAILAEEEADAAIAEQTEAIKNIEIKVSTKLDATKAGKKGIKVTWKTADGKKLDGVEFFRSVKKNSGYGKKAFFTSKKAGTTGYYLNTKSLKKGTRYYYRVRGYVLVDGQKVYTDWSNKGIRTFR